MKTKQFFTLAALLVLLLGMILSGCKKEKTNKLPEDSSTLQQVTKDENQVQDATDDAFNDVNLLLSSSSSSQLKSSFLWGGPCNVTVDSPTVIGDTIIYHIRYHGNNCHQTVSRYGVVEVKKNLNTNWYMPNATVFVTFINDTITRLASGKSLILNGKKRFENVTGGVIWQLGNGISSITHKISGNLIATFDDGTIRTWHISRLRTFTGTPPLPTDTVGHLILTEDGFGNEGGYDKLCVWGTNRNGEEFYTQINESVVHKQDFNFDPCSGVKVFQIPGKSKKATVTFGFDDNNQPVTCDTWPDRYRVDWEVNGQTGTVYLPLH